VAYNNAVILRTLDVTDVTPRRSFRPYRSLTIAQNLLKRMGKKTGDGGEHEQD
jgi:hypothetical protein